MSEKIESFTSMIRGLSATRTNKDNHDTSVLVDNLYVSPFQPRKSINEAELYALAESIKQNGLINPITVRASSDNGKFEIIAGERRYRAIMLLAWKTAPVIIKDVNDKVARAIALVENLQRENLNPIEEAAGYAELLENHNLTHEQVAQAVGKPRSTVSNLIRLLDLDEKVKNLLESAAIEVGHAKLLVALSKETQINLAENIVKKNLSVRQLEASIKKTVVPSSRHNLNREGVDNSKLSMIAMLLKKKTGIEFTVSISGGQNKISFANEDCSNNFLEALLAAET